MFLFFIWRGKGQFRLLWQNFTVKKLNIYSKSNKLQKYLQSQICLQHFPIVNKVWATNYKLWICGTICTINCASEHKMFKWLAKIHDFSLELLIVWIGFSFCLNVMWERCLFPFVRARIEVDCRQFVVNARCACQYLIKQPLFTWGTKWIVLKARRTKLSSTFFPIKHSFTLQIEQKIQNRVFVGLNTDSMYLITKKNMHFLTSHWFAFGYNFHYWSLFFDKKNKGRNFCFRHFVVDSQL